LPGGMVLGEDNAVIQTTALHDRLRLEDEVRHPAWFVATHSDDVGNVIGTFIVQAERTIEAIEKIEQDMGRHFWLTEGEHVVGFPKLALTVPFIGLQRIRKDNCLL